METSPIRSIVDRLDAKNMLAAEFSSSDVASSVKEPLSKLLKDYPQLERHPGYLEFLELTGGAHIHSREISLGVFGFGGYVVRSFQEASPLDQDKYFIFADLVYSSQSSATYYFAFDITSNDQSIFVAKDEEGGYLLYCSSFSELLNFALDQSFPEIDSR